MKLRSCLSWIYIVCYCVLIPTPPCQLVFQVHGAESMHGRGPSQGGRPISMVSHVVNWWSSKNLVQRGKFMETCGNIRAAERAFALAIEKDDSDVAALFAYACFLHQSMR
jgi:hypothetical protein